MAYKNKKDKAASELRRYYRIRAETMAEFGGKCVECESTESLEFDHINPEEKEYNVSKMWSLSKAKREEESKKCQLLCKDCHKEKHGIKEHGYSMYKHRGCRCRICKDGLAAYTREYRKKYGRK